MQIIKGKEYADQILADIKLKVGELAARNIKIILAIVLVGENPSSKIYVNNKMKRAKEVGIDTLLISLPHNITQEKLLAELARLNKANEIHGIIVQLPLPDHINKHIVQQVIFPTKDVDGFHPLNVGMLHSNTIPQIKLDIWNLSSELPQPILIGENSETMINCLCTVNFRNWYNIREGFVPCTPQGCLHLIKEVCPDLTGKLAVVIGRSSIVGNPMGALLLQEDATVIMCHSKTQNLHELTRQADIVVSAMGKPLSLKGHHFKKGAIVIDVGITRMEDGSISGDVDFEDVKDAGLAAISPVPGGVGPMTIAYLLLNVLKAASNGI